MTVELATAYVNLVPSARGFGRETERQLTGGGKGSVAGKTGRKVGLALMGGVTAGVATAGAGVFKGLNFDNQMREVFTLLPDITGDAMGEMTNSVKQFALDFGVLPNDVVPALYQSISAGVPRSNVFDFLETAQQAAKGGVTDLTTAVDGISSVVNAYGADVMSATDASDLMFTAVRLGKTDFEQLSSSLFNVTPTTAALGVGFEDVTAALASMTAQGVPTSVATTQLRQMFVELSKEGSKTSGVFEEMAGQSFREFIAEGGNTQGALELLVAGAEEAGISVADMFGSVEAGAAALSLTGENADGFADNLAAMEDSAGSTAKAFDTMNDDSLQPWVDKLKVFGQLALIWIGEKAIPVILEAVDIFRREWPRIRLVLDRVGEAVRQVVARLVTFGQWANENRAVVATFVGVLAGFLIVRQITTAVLAFNAALAANPIVLVVAALAALAAGLVWAYQNVEWFRDIVDDAADVVVAAFEWISDAAETVWVWLADLWDRSDGLRAFLAGAFSATIRAVVVGWRSFVTAMTAVWRWLRDLWDRSEGLRAFLAAAFVATLRAVSIGWDALTTAISTVWRWLRTVWDRSEGLRGFLVGALKTALDVQVTVWGLVKTAIETAWRWVRIVWDRTEGLREFLVGAFKAALDTQVTIWGAVVTAITTAWRWLRIVWDRSEGLREFYVGIWSTGLGIAVAAVEGLIGIVQTLVGWLDTVIDRAKSAIEWLAKLNPFDKSIDIPNRGVIGDIGGGSGRGSGGAGATPRAAGGRLRAGQLGLVGEEGPELWVPDMAGIVVPTDQTAAMLEQLAGGAGFHYHHHGEAMTPSELAHAQKLARILG